MNIILFGPPGAGKGTQGDHLAKTFDLFNISTGDLLREEVKKKNQLSKKINLTINEGKLVSDEIIKDLLKNIISNKKFSNKLIFDGYPRNLNQAKTLDFLLTDLNQTISFVFHIKVDEDIVTKRILGRQTCSQCGLIFNKYFKPATQNNHNCDESFLTTRSDDNETVIRQRFKIYTKQTLPILDFYNKQNLLYEINGMGDFTMIFNEISRIINPLEA